MSCMVFGDVSQLTHAGRTEVLSTDKKFESGLQNFAGRLFSQFPGCCELQIYGHCLFVIVVDDPCSYGFVGYLLA